ncbi:PREDICTED: ubiquitin carboxyl-terminal hydrolase 2 isoform X2 [Dinoponera quadriceps]|uniref:Ubiquitin carboxyl-terminal hydrolase n=1 Tax=Dinoponera quadriceps TaxID=609295 RepID=A0A6P3X4C4_DINQU|nr:PREDICTED: ubiquitin carboxyl-terminal hydrolase 2 isoform X2 [Dinoponera quadriceps]
MSYHRGGQAGAVAVSYSTSPMAPHSPSRRYSSGTTGTTTTSGIGSSTSKFSAYRSTGGTSSILDQPTSFYTPSSAAGSSLRSNYISSEYRRSYCASGRSVSSSSYGETGGSSLTSAASVVANGTGGGRYSGSSTSSTSSSRERNVETAADIISRYSPAGYVPNIRQSASTGGAHHWKHRSTSSSLSELFGGDERELVERRDRPESSLSSSSSTSSAATGGGLWSRSAKRRPPASSTLLTSGHARADSAASLAEVTIDDHVSRKLDDDHDGDVTKDVNGDDDQHNNNGNLGNDGKGAAAEGGFGVNNNDDERDDDDEDGDKDDDDDDDDNRNSRQRNRQQQQQHHHHHHHLRQQRNRRPDEVSPAKRNLSPTGGGGLIGDRLDLLTNLATNPRNTELLINNNAQEKKATRGEEAANNDDEVIRAPEDEDGARSTSIDAITTFLQDGRSTATGERDEDGDEERRGASYSMAEGGFSAAITATLPVLQNGVSGRPSVTHCDEPSSSIPSTSRRTEQPGLFPTAANSSTGSLTSSPTTNPTHHSLYRGGNEQYEGSPTNRSARNRLQAYRDERCGLNGLRNIGNTCFMNSVIQCLSNTRPLLEYLLNEQYLSDINTSTSSMKGALIKAFSQVIHELWEVGGDHVVNTTSLKSQIQRFAPRFMGYSQQDAQEFLRYLLEGLHEDVNRVTTKLAPIHGDIPDSYSETQKAVESWKRYLRSEDSMIVDVFVGQLRSSLHCTSCDHVSVTLDPFWDLSLPIPARSGTVKLSQCLEHFTREEVLDGDEKPTCSKCQMRRKCTKSFSIQKFPKILVIHLKRFSPMERFRGKLNVMVDFPLTGLDLSAFAAPKVPGCTYNLYGVANHSGTTYSGHYTAYCKHPYSGEWHEYNDSRVSVVSARSVVSSEAYVLFYEQQPHNSHL